MPENRKPEDTSKKADDVERDQVDQDPGERQKRNQDDKEDPLAA